MADKEGAADLVWQTAKRYDSPKAGLLADWHSITKDLEYALEAGTRALSITPDDSDEKASGIETPVELKALWNSAVISYARCFSGGVRQARLDGAFAAMGSRESEFRAAHDYIMNLRSKYIAHSVNRFEDTQIIVVVDEQKDTGQKVLGAGPIRVTPAYEKKTNVQSFINVTKCMLQEAGKQFNYLAHEVLEEAKGLSDAELLELSEMGIQLPMLPDEVNRGRSR